MGYRTNEIQHKSVIIAANARLYVEKIKKVTAEVKKIITIFCGMYTRVNINEFLKISLKLSSMVTIKGYMYMCIAMYITNTMTIIKNITKYIQFAVLR